MTIFKVNRMFNGNRYLLSVGLENGGIWIYSCTGCDSQMKCDVFTVVDEAYSHTAAVKKLAWRPRNDDLSLATCSLDHCVKILGFNSISL